MGIWNGAGIQHPHAFDLARGDRGEQEGEKPTLDTNKTLSVSK